MKTQCGLERQRRQNDIENEIVCQGQRKIDVRESHACARDDQPNCVRQGRTPRDAGCENGNKKKGYSAGEDCVHDRNLLSINQLSRSGLTSTSSCCFQRRRAPGWKLWGEQRCSPSVG
jgi:hypothetical protein